MILESDCMTRTITLDIIINAAHSCLIDDKNQHDQ